MKYRSVIDTSTDSSGDGAKGKPLAKISKIISLVMIFFRKIKKKKSFKCSTYVTS
jgi:hypothetical protein